MSSHCVQIARRLAWQRGQKERHLYDGQQILVHASLGPDARGPVAEHATGEELVGDLRDDRAPRDVLARKALVVDRRQAVQMVRYQL